MNVQDSNRNNVFFRFEDLRVYNKAVDLVTYLVTASSSFVGSDHGFFEKFIDEMSQIALNLADGASKSKAEFSKNLNTIKSNIKKCVVYNTIAFKSGLINLEQRDEIRGQLMEITKMIGALMTSLGRQTNSSEKEDVENW